MTANEQMLALMALVPERITLSLRKEGRVLYLTLVDNQEKKFVESSISVNEMRIATLDLVTFSLNEMLYKLKALKR